MGTVGSGCGHSVKAARGSQQNVGNKGPLKHAGCWAWVQSSFEGSERGAICKASVKASGPLKHGDGWEWAPSSCKDRPTDHAACTELILVLYSVPHSSIVQHTACCSSKGIAGSGCSHPVKSQPGVAEGQQAH